MQTRQPTIGKARKDLATDVRSLVTHAEQLMQATAAASGSGLEKVRDNLAESLEAAKTRVVALEAAAMERGRITVRQTTKLVQENPWQAMAIAAMAGIVFAKLTSSSKARAARAD
ncbi:MAG TPA: hypothetical protein VGE51_01215 [Fontimonas sp.]